MSNIDYQSELRKKAENKIAGQNGKSSKNVTNLRPEEINQAFHDLHVHKIELEIQN